MIKWIAPFDPDETKDYAVDWTGEMTRVNDTITGQDFTIVTQNTGLQVQSHNVDGTGKLAIVWFTAADETLLRTHAGTVVTIDHVVNTVGGRTYNVTLGLKIKEK